jgi:hypothetical protein
MILEPIGGTAVFFLGLWMWLHIFLFERSPGAATSSTDVFVFSMLVFPGLLVVVGCYLQAFRSTRWPAVLVLLGGIWNMMFVGINALFAFTYAGDKSGQLAVVADLFLALFTMVVACINVARNDPYLFPDGTVEQIVGRERRERVSHHQRCGEG